MCKYCKNGSSLLFEIKNIINDVILFGLEDDDTVEVRDINKYTYDEDILVDIDRGYLCLWFGEDRGCIDHALDKIKINYCPICGSEIGED